MRSALRIAIALPLVWLRIGVHLVVAIAIVALGFPLISRATQRRLIGWWSCRVLAICGVSVRVVGPRPGISAAVTDAMRPGGIGAMLVMNHISWADVYVVHAVRAARFVAKAEIAKWPVIGYLTDRTGTIFIERGRRHAVREANHRAAQLLRDRELVVMFPEGTTGDGDRLLPFHVNLIQSAVDARAAVVVAGLRYVDANGTPTLAASYTGDTTLLQSIVRIVRMGPVTAELHLLDAIDGATATRHEVGRRARALIAEALDFDDESEEAAEGISTVIVVPDDPGSGRDAAAMGVVAEIDHRDELL